MSAANGLYALASLDGRPLALDDLGVLGLGESDQRASGCVLAARDVRASAVHVRVHPDGIDALIGELDEPEELARLLGLPATDPLTIAGAAFDRFGDRAPRQMLGSWLFARWHAPSATLTLLMAEQVRDTCYVAVGRGLVAVAPELPRIARLGWVDAEPDPRNLLMMLGRAGLRRGIGDGTILRGVHRVLPGTCVRIAANGLGASVAEPAFAPQTARAVSFDDALEEIDGILRRIMRQHFERYGDSAFMLSGGLDSSLLGLIGSIERGHHAMTFLTSAAPPGSGIADETEFAGMVAAHLGLAMREIVPPETANVYRPSHQTFATAQGPMLSPRHYLDETLQAATRALRVGAMVDGAGGESTVTNHGYFLDHVGGPTPIRSFARALRDRWRRVPDRWPGAAFHIRLSDQALADLPADFADIWQHNDTPAPMLRPDQPIGVAAGVVKAGIIPSTTTDRHVRCVTPFADRRLVHAVATMPADFTRHDGQRRAIARFLMQRRLPDAIAFRVSKAPFSPNYKALMHDTADVAIARIPAFRASGVDAWIDLDWLAAALSTIKNTPINDQGAMFELQMTAIAAEYLLWWREQTQ